MKIRWWYGLETQAIEYVANVDVKLFKSPGYLYRTTLKAGTHITSSNSRDGWLQIETPLQYTAFWGEAKYFSGYTPPPPPDDPATLVIAANGLVAVDPATQTQWTNRDPVTLVKTG
jgi:hypothetical protein